MSISLYAGTRLVGTSSNSEFEGILNNIGVVTRQGAYAEILQESCGHVDPRSLRKRLMKFDPDSLFESGKASVSPRCVLAAFQNLWNACDIAEMQESQVRWHD